MFPIKNYKQYKIGYRHGDPTFYSDFHFGIDIWTAENTPVYAPFSGTAEKTWGPGGGLTIHFKANNKVYRFLHLNSVVRVGNVREGELLALTGGKPGNPNAGNSTNPHVHFDISKGSLQLNNRSNFLDPEKEIWNMLKPSLRIVANNIDWTTLPQKVEELKNYFKEMSGGRIELSVDVVHTQINDVPFIPYSWGTSQQMYGVDHGWYDQYVLPYGMGYTFVFFLMNMEQWKGVGARGWRTDMNAGPVELQGASNESEVRSFPNGQQYPDLLSIVSHEIMHGLYMIHNSGVTWETMNNLIEDNTHKWFDVGTLEKCFDEFNYELLSNKINRKEDIMSNVLIVRKGSEYGFYVPATNGASMIDKGLNFGKQIPVLPDGKIDFPKLNAMLQGEVIVK